MQELFEILFSLSSSFHGVERAAYEQFEESEPVESEVYCCSKAF